MSRKQHRNREMKKVYIPLAAMLAMLSPLDGHAQEARGGGEIALTPTLADVNGSEAKFNEYRDIEDGLYGALRFWRETDDLYWRFQADDILYDTQSYRLDGGDYGRYKFNLFYDEIPHNLTYDAITFYSGAGTANLTYSGANQVNVAPSTDTSTWNTFDYKVDRERQGAGLRLDLWKPLYFDVSYNREDREGIKPAGLAPGTTGGSNALEFPEPVDYVTDNLKTELGYALNPLFATVAYSYSKFENANENLTFRHPASANFDTFTLPPGNDYYKLAFKGGAKLPMSSSLNLNASRGVAESSVGLFSSYLDTNGLLPANGSTTFTLSDPLFDGKVVTTSRDVILTSNPLPFLDGKLFYKYYEKENKSDEITHTRVQAGLDPFHNHLFGYEKDTYGAELGFRLPANLSLTPSYKHVKVERERGDLPESKDDVYGVDVRWTGLDFLTVHAGYEQLNRTATWQQLELVTGTQATADAIEPFIRRFDAAPQDRDTYKLGLDIYPTDNLSFGLGYRHINADYPDTILGLRDEESNIYDLSADYTLGRLGLAGYLSYEDTERFQFQRRFTSAANADPALGFSAANNHNWSIADDFETYDFGLSADYVLVPAKWRLKVQYDQVYADGFGDFTLYDGATITGFDNDTLDLENWDDYRLSAFQIKAIYDISSKLSTTFGYAYEKYDYSDATLDDYVFTYNTTSLTAANYLTGAYKDQSYEANVFYATLKYSF